MSDHHELKSRIQEERADKRRRFYFYVLVVVSFAVLFIVSIDYASQGPSISQINSSRSTPEKTTDADRFGFTHSWINPIFRKSSE